MRSNITNFFLRNVAKNICAIIALYLGFPGCVILARYSKDVSRQCSLQADRPTRRPGTDPSIFPLDDTRLFVYPEQPTTSEATAIGSTPD